MSQGPIHVVKLGGSLLDLPDVLERFARWRREHLQGRGVLLIGGGVSADTVRFFDRHAEMSEEAGHWLAVRAMALNSHVIAEVLPHAQLIHDASELERAWCADRLAIVEPLAWLESEEAAGHGVAHRWSFTSDSIAAHIAMRTGAKKLTLLKSTSFTGTTIEEAARAGVVDADFATASRVVPEVWIVNLRDTDPSPRLIT